LRAEPFPLSADSTLWGHTFCSCLIAAAPGRGPLEPLNSPPCEIGRTFPPLLRRCFSGPSRPFLMGPFFFSRTCYLRVFLTPFLLTGPDGRFFPRACLTARFFAVSTSPGGFSPLPFWPQVFQRAMGLWTVFSGREPLVRRQYFYSFLSLFPQGRSSDSGPSLLPFFPPQFDWDYFSVFLGCDCFPLGSPKDHLVALPSARCPHACFNPAACNTRLQPFSPAPLLLRVPCPPFLS